MDGKQLVSMLTNFKEEIIEAFDQRIGIVEENVQHKFELVVEGQQMRQSGWTGWELSSSKRLVMLINA